LYRRREATRFRTAEFQIRLSGNGLCALLAKVRADLSALVKLQLLRRSQILPFELLLFDPSAIEDPHPVNVHSFNRIDACALPFFKLDEGAYAFPALGVQRASAYNKVERFGVPSPYSV
jgi:hypothetical protein